MLKTLISTVPFGARDSLPLELLRQAGIEAVVNPLGRKLSEDQLAEMIGDFDALVAGTEPITDRVMQRARNLRIISRVGVGLDGVDLLAARDRGIRVCYTPEAPAPAVAELTIGLMLTLLRSIHTANERMHGRVWDRIFGRRIGDSVIGVIGLGRIGKRVIECLSGFAPKAILVNDLNEDPALDRQFGLLRLSKDEIYRQSDVITLHVPLTPITRNMIIRADLLAMKPDALLINTARGGIVNETDLHDVLSAGHLGGAAVDVFENEPYAGSLSSLDRCVLTSHMGSMSADCRARMEIEAVQAVVNFFSGAHLQGEVPEQEYLLHAARV